MKNLRLLLNSNKNPTSKGFADFFLHAPEKRMQEVFKEAARRANEDQRRLFSKYGNKTI